MRFDLDVTSSRFKIHTGCYSYKLYVCRNECADILPNQANGHRIPMPSILTILGKVV